MRFQPPDFSSCLVREYHHKYYVPHNLSLIVSGKLASGTHSLLKVVQEKVEPSIIQHGQNLGPKPAGWKRPFVETPSANRGPLKETQKKVIEFPEKDESLGEIYMGFMGPPPNKFIERKVGGIAVSRSRLLIRQLRLSTCSRHTSRHRPSHP